ncbi:hypothetical protein F0562_008917 [Nyssa sinensis]|uniref:Uncharacterized protein n=1 Tax=Nyssa sinensis TaxID=561372 RepID=A0A5J5A9F4_9ASTE|nr:hypothetical protein F0562_008917 [Nyssa sinensis]
MPQQLMCPEDTGWWLCPEDTRAAEASAGASAYLDNSWLETLADWNVWRTLDWSVWRTLVDWSVWRTLAGGCVLEDTGAAEASVGASAYLDDRWLEVPIPPFRTLAGRLCPEDTRAVEASVGASAYLNVAGIS